jgi:hypothetical protein
VLLAGLTKPGEVGEIFALYRLKSLSLDYKAKLKSPCFFLQVTLFLQIIFVDHMFEKTLKIELSPIPQAYHLNTEINVFVIFMYLLYRLQSEIKVALFLFASHSFLANNLRLMVKLIVKTIVINGKIHKNKRKRFI